MLTLLIRHLHFLIFLTHFLLYFRMWFFWSCYWKFVRCDSDTVVSKTLLAMFSLRCKSISRFFIFIIIIIVTIVILSKWIIIPKILRNYFNTSFFIIKFHLTILARHGIIFEMISILLILLTYTLKMFKLFFCN